MGDPGPLKKNLAILVVVTVSDVLHVLGSFFGRVWAIKESLGLDWSKAWVDHSVL